jgi:hypothetical protein
MNDENGNPTEFKPHPRSLIPCRVIPGMFRDEWLLLIDAVDPKDPEKKIEVQMFADKPLVVRLEGTPTRDQPARGWLKVYQVGIANGLARILLPVGEYLLIQKDLVEPEVAA